MNRGAALAVVVALAAPLVPQLAHAEDRSPSSRHDTGAGSERVPRRVVTVEIAGDERSVADTTTLLRERLASQPIDVTYAAAETIDPATVVTPANVHDDDLARVWIDMRHASPSAAAPGGPRRVTLYVVDGPWERVFIRHFTRHDNPEVTREEIGHVVELALVALVAGERIGVGRDIARAELAPAAAPAPPPPAAAPPPPDRVETKPEPAPATKTRFHAGPFFEMQAYGAGPEVRSGIGGLVEVHRTPPTTRLRYGASVLLQYRFPTDADAGAATTVRSEGAAAHLLAHASYAVSRPAELAVMLGPGLEMNRAEARGDRAASVTFAGGETSYSPVARLLVRYTHAFPDLFQLFAGVGLDVPFERTRYLLARPTGGGSTVLFEQWAARPFLVLGVSTP